MGNIETISENGELKAKYYYDELSQLVREDNKELSQTIVYEYDQGGNIRSKTRYAYTEGELGEAIGTDTYSYQAEGLWVDVLTGYNGQKFTYDEIGNPLSYRDGMSFTWQNGRQLSRAQNSEELISYSYNADGIRTRKLRSNGETTDYYLNGSNIITQITNSILNPDHSVRLDFYYDENSSLLGFAYDGQDYWYIRNGQGDIIGILDKDGNEVVSYTYDSWGAPISTTGSLADTIGQLNPFRYRGYYYDAELGLYYLNSRYYDPITGRFINLDCYIMSGNSLLSGNMYLYCENNPIRRVDPAGSSFFDSPLSTATLAAMSPKMREEYYAARAKYLASVASQGNRNVQQTSLPKTGKPNSKETLPNPDGTPKQERWYGPNGEPVKDRDYNHGGNHEFPHDHEWNNGVRGPAIPVPKTEISYVDVGTGVVIGVGAVGVGYLIYRGVRMLPSLLPPLWWTIPANAVIP